MRLKSYRRIVDFQKIAAKKGLVPRAAKKPIGEQKYSTNSQNTIFFVFGPKTLYLRAKGAKIPKTNFSSKCIWKYDFWESTKHMQHIRKESRPQSSKRKVSSQNTYVHAFSYLFETDPLFKKRILYCVFWVTLSRRIGDSES